MARIRSVVTLPWTSGLAEDVSVNVFHFLTTSTPATSAELDVIDTNLEGFYNTSSGVAGDDLAGFLSVLIKRTASACSIAHYNIDDPEPRQPLRETFFTLNTNDNGVVGPPEVALCLSFQAAPISGIPQARRRGRVYLGPFSGGTTVMATDGRPSTALVNSAAAAGNLLLDSLQGAVPVRWTVYSRAGDAMAEVADGWCDNEWDTMRSRGRDAQTRTTFT